MLSFRSLDEAKRHVIDKEIENFLKRKDTDEQLKYLKNELKADIASHFKQLPVFKELILRRHAIVHAGGVASAEYIRRAKRLKGMDLAKIEEGTKLPLSAKYIITAWNVTYSLGVILLHLVARECARSKRSKDEEDQADKFLINSVFSCIQNAQYIAAESILQYANNLRLASDTSDLMVIINLAQTYRWQEKIEECKNLLHSKDWSAYSTLFQLCVAALNDDADGFKKLLPEVATQKSISITELCDWPVFRLMRSKEEFNVWIKSAFGEEAASVTELFKPKLINMSPDKTLKALMKYIGEDSDVFASSSIAQCQIEQGQEEN